ncbi:MAG TPA: cytochrome c peroxidase, partial [Acetobacteraceae bacterium]|nr:cytochrome c peroxidase [Acetobacteraceae bacterium]
SDPAAMLLARGENPHPVQLTRPPVAPLSAMARLGRRIFFDSSLSAAGRLSCASCHDPANHYGPPPHTGPVMLGGAHLTRQGLRAVPTLTYLERQPGFSIGPDNAENETAPNPQTVALRVHGPRPEKIAGDPAPSAAALVPQGGLFWDGRVDTLQQQALQPLLNPVEMANASAASVAAKLRRAPYVRRFVPLFGPSILHDPRLLLSEAMFAVARYQIEDPSFHPYSSKYDAWLEGKARLTPAEMRGYRLFNDAKTANCAGCHLDQPRADGTPPRFTDGQFEALGVPRNPALTANRNPHFHDLGLCGPVRQDLRADTQYCGMFLTPTLRNVATRHAFFHNGVFHSLRQVLDFYRFRDTDPARVYPAGADGRPATFNDLPPRYRGNVDVTDPPFDRKPGYQPAFTARDAADIIAFLRTLTDGYKPEHGGRR